MIGLSPKNNNFKCFECFQTRSFYYQWESVSRLLYRCVAKLQKYTQKHTLPHFFLSTLASWRLIMLFSEMLKFSKIISSKSKNILWRKIVNIQEYSICWNECFKINLLFIYLFIYLFIRQTCVEMVKVLRYFMLTKRERVSGWVTFMATKKQSFKRFRLMPVHLVPIWVDYGKGGVYSHLELV